MRDDLSDAQASVDWAKAQIPILEKRFPAWERTDPYTACASDKVLLLMQQFRMKLMAQRWRREFNDANAPKN